MNANIVLRLNWKRRVFRGFSSMPYFGGFSRNCFTIHATTATLPSITFRGSTISSGANESALRVRCQVLFRFFSMPRFYIETGMHIITPIRQEKRKIAQLAHRPLFPAPDAAVAVQQLKP